MIAKKITSTQNSFVKELIQLQEKSKKRKSTGTFVVEGIREIELAIKCKYEVITIVYNSTNILEAETKKYTSNSTKNLIEVSQEVYNKIAYRGSTEGLIAVVKSKQHALSSLEFKSKKPLILVAEAPEKPGNIGALLRTADAANVDAVIIANPKTDLYNPNIIRSSVGCVFTTPIALDKTENILHYLKSEKINIYCAALKDESKIYSIQDYTKATAIVVGTEAKGLSDTWLNSENKKIIIPMLGKIDSMNVSVSAGILIYEAKRQRNFL